MTGYVYPRPEDAARFPFEPYRWEPLPPAEQRARGQQFHDRMAARRSVRTFSDRPVPRELIELAIATAATAPSGAHQQPWTFAITDDPAVKHRIRVAAEAEEATNYDGGRMGEEWTDALARLGTYPAKGYLEDAPWLVVAFTQRYGVTANGRRQKHYYATESVGIACGLFIAALQTMGLATLTHTPSPMGFLRDIFGRPANEKPLILFPVGYPAEGSMVPSLDRKPLSEIMVEPPPETRYDVRRLTAFTDDPAGGNPAGVVVSPALPAPEEMQRIAAGVGYSETAFLAPGPDADDGAYVVRYFSPQAEVDFCGHATIAAGVVLGTQRGAGTYRLHTNVGVVPVEVARRDDGRFVATLTSVEPGQREVPADVLHTALEMFGWTSADLDPTLPPVEAFAGAWHLVVPLRSREALAGMTYRFEDLRALMTDRGLTTLQVIWRQDDTTIISRNPFPVGGVVEDPATGAAAAALGGYLRDAGQLSAPVDLTIHQGEDLGRPSLIRVHIPTSGGIRVTGTAVPDPV